MLHAGLHSVNMRAGPEDSAKLPMHTPGAGTQADSALLSNSRASIHTDIPLEGGGLLDSPYEKRASPGNVHAEEPNPFLAAELGMPSLASPFSPNRDGSAAAHDKMIDIPPSEVMVSGRSPSQWDVVP